MRTSKKHQETASRNINDPTESEVQEQIKLWAQVSDLAEARVFNSEMTDFAMTQKLWPCRVW